MNQEDSFFKSSHDFRRETGKPWEEGEERINQVVFIGRNLDDIRNKVWI